MRLSRRLVEGVAREALEQRVLGPIDAHVESVEAGHVTWRVARITNLARKKAATRSAAADPFADPEPALLVPGVHLSHHHVLPHQVRPFPQPLSPLTTGRQFPVMDHHLLLVTKRYESQADALTRSDFDAVCALRSASDEPWLVFYNHGPLSGQSQPHKHLQLIPYPVVGATPLEQVYCAERGPAIPFHFFARHLGSEEASDAARLHDIYARELLPQSQKLSASSNLVLTPSMMLVVPRSAEGATSLNSLAFCFCLLAADAAGFEELKMSPWRALERVCFPVARH